MIWGFIPGMAGWYDAEDPLRQTTVIEYRGIEVYVRDEASVRHILKQHTALQRMAGQRPYAAANTEEVRR